MKQFILKGFHYSNFLPCIFKKNTTDYSLSKKIKFDKSCKYIIQEKSCVNKLFGWSYGIFGVHKNSVRFGWTSDGNDEITIWSYFYTNGKLYKTKIYTVKIDEFNTYTISTRTVGKYTLYSFIINGKTIHEEYVEYVDVNWLCTLGFYFGGNTRAPHNMYIVIE